MTRRTGTKDISNTITERKGVCEIEKRCCSINWVFRERGHSDFGIDADMEESVIENGVPKLTNRHIALQIKSGESFFAYDRRKKQYYFKIPDHRIANYWLGSDRPVLLMAYKPENDNSELSSGTGGEVYWAQIKQSNIQKVSNRQSKKGRKGGKESQHMYGKIYLSNRFSNDSAKDFSDIISTYLPTFDAQLGTPSTFLSPELTEENAKKLEHILKELINSMNNVVDSIEQNCFLFDDDGAQYTDKRVYYEIEGNRLVLFYNKEICNLLLSRYIDSIVQQKEFSLFCLPEFDKKINDEIEECKSVLGKLKGLIEKYEDEINNVTPETDIQCSLVNQAKAVMEDYLNMLEYHLNRIGNI